MGVHRAATRLTLLLAGLAASAALAPTATAAAERIVAAGIDGAEDVRAARVGRPQVSFSPDGDGIADRAWFEVEGAPGDVVRLAAFWRFQGARGVWASAPATIGDDGRVRITWDGTATRTQPPVVDDGTTRTAGDASYTIAVCRDGRCASDDPETTAVALVRRLSVGIATTRTHAAGETVPLVLRTPETSLVGELQREPYRPGAVPLARRRLDPLRPRFRLPHRLRPGMYRLVVTDGAGAVRALPLPVRGPRPTTPRAPAPSSWCCPT